MTLGSVFSVDWQSLGGGVCVFLLLVLAVMIQGWLLFFRDKSSLGVDPASVTEAAANGVTPPAPRRRWWLRAAAVLFFLLLKTGLIGFAVYWCLWVQRMGAIWFFCGLGLGLLIFTSAIMLRSLVAKNAKYD